MQLTSPIFLFLFLPLSLPLLPLCPARHRKAVLTLISASWFLLANRSEPVALLQILLLLALVCVIAALPDRAPRLRCAIGVALPLGALLAARLLAEYAPFPYVYPTGLTMIALAAISMAVDRYRGDAPEREGPLPVISYLLFFPVMLTGPILRYKQFLYVTEHITPDRARFARGTQLYMLGFCKRVAVAAVLLRAIREMLFFTKGQLPILALLLLLVMSYLLLYTFISGTTDMARGLMEMLGMHAPRGQSGTVPLLLPHRVFYSLLLSFDRYLKDYVTGPILRRLPRTPARILCAVLMLALTVLFYRTRPEMLLLALPLLLTALLALSRGDWMRYPRHPLGRALIQTVTVLCLSVLSLGMLLDNPLDVITLFRSSFASNNTYTFYHLFGAVAGTGYLAICLLVAVLIPLARYAPYLARRLPERVVFPVRIALSLVLCLAFAGTILYFLPQFPHYTDPAYGSFLFVR